MVKYYKNALKHIAHMTSKACQPWYYFLASKTRLSASQLQEITNIELIKTIFPPADGTEKIAKIWLNFMINIQS